ncbi:MAG: DUF1398 family protein [Gammaproteobacteria bacterium]|nr:DUF1398 family protein [Gammaproteobacteria bacterium]
MNTASQEIILKVFRESSEGRLHFGTVVGLLMQAGVESYAVDYRTGKTTYYPPDGETLSLDLEMPDVAIADAFDSDALKAAIRGSQQGVVQYPEFKRLSREAGCVGYTVWIQGRHVTYFGRRGETHVERFPS